MLLKHQSWALWRQVLHLWSFTHTSDNCIIYLKYKENQIKWAFIWHDKQIHWDGTVIPHFSSFWKKKKCVKIHKCSAQEKKIRTQRDFVTLNLHESFLGSVNLQNCNKSGHPSPEPPQSLTIILFLAQSLNAIVVICTTLQQLSVTRTWIMMKQKCSDPLSA